MYYPKTSKNIQKLSIKIIKTNTVSSKICFSFHISSLHIFPSFLASKMCNCCAQPSWFNPRAPWSMWAIMEKFRICETGELPGSNACRTTADRGWCAVAPEFRLSRLGRWMGCFLFGWDNVKITVETCWNQGLYTQIYPTCKVLLQICLQFLWEKLMYMVHLQPTI